MLWRERAVELRLENPDATWQELSEMVRAEFPHKGNYDSKRWAGCVRSQVRRVLPPGSWKKEGSVSKAFIKARLATLSSAGRGSSSASAVTSSASSSVKPAVSVRERPVLEANKLPDALLGSMRGGRVELGKALALCGGSGRVLDAVVLDLKEDGYRIDIQDGQVVLSRFGGNVEPVREAVSGGWDGSRTIKIGALSDTHLGSLWEQPSLLRKAYEDFEREGITQVFHAGDVTEGEKMRAGHEYEIHLHGADAFRDYVIDVYPRVEGITTYMIGGNHDASFLKLAGFDLPASVSAARDDIRYLGFDQAYVELTPNCVLELRHPRDGASYSADYKIQKIVEAMFGGTKPSILIVGHYHRQLYTFERNVHCIMPACLQAQTPFTRGKNLKHAVGYCILEITVNEQGQVDEFAPRFKTFYKTVKDDYLQPGRR